MEALDEGSDLSDLGDELSPSPPPTPGQAVTPQTSPVHKSARHSSSTAASTSLNKNVSGGKSNSKAYSKPQDGKKARSKARKGQAKGPGNVKGRSGSWNYSVEEPSSAVGSKAQSGKGKQVGRPKMNRAEPAGADKAGSSAAPTAKKASNMKGYAFVPQDDIKSQDTPALEGRRSRKPTQQYANGGKGAKSGRRAAGGDLAGPEESPPEAEPASTNPESSQSKVRIKINVHLTPKNHEHQGKEEGPLGDPTGSPMDEDEDEEAQPTRKRKRRRMAAAQRAADEAGNGEAADDDDKGPAQSTSKTGIRHKKKRRGNRGRPRKEAKAKPSDDDEGTSDDYREDNTSENDVLSDDADDDDPLLPAKKGSREPSATATRLKRKSEDLLSDGKKVESRKPAGPVSSKTTGLPQQPPRSVGPAASSSAQAGTPVRPVVAKAAIRKVPSRNLYADLMGFGGPSKDTPTGKHAATPARVRPPGSGVNTPQANSPIVRPPGSSQKKEGERSGADGATPVRLSSSSAKPSPMASDGKGRLMTVDVKGANGEHVTAAQMAARKEEELHSNANPRNLFDLLEGAEVMMQFEEETRQLLPSDPFIGRHKLYKASRTEGLPKLIERIRETVQRQRDQATEEEAA